MVMESNESWERIDQGLSRAASCCRELGALTSINSWHDLSKQLLIMRKKARVMYESAPLSEVQVQVLVTNMEIAQLAAENLRGMNG
jgi:hypothetical protein